MEKPPLTLVAPPEPQERSKHLSWGRRKTFVDGPGDVGAPQPERANANCCMFAPQLKFFRNYRPFLTLYVYSDSAD